MLTRAGICAQILGSLSTYRETVMCSQNDCKVVINHLVRKYSEPLQRDGRERHYISTAARQLSSGTVREHLVPVAEIMRRLLELPCVAVTRENVATLDALLTDLLVIVTVTPEEDAALNTVGLQRAMPNGYFDQGHDLYRDRWARYKVAGIYEGIVQESPESEAG